MICGSSVANLTGGRVNFMTYLLHFILLVVIAGGFLWPSYTNHCIMHNTIEFMMCDNQKLITKHYWTDEIAF